MTLKRVSDTIADEMVERLFAESNPDRWEAILYPGCGDGALIDAVHRYCNANGMLTEPPDGTAVDIDPEQMDEVKTLYGDDIETFTADFLTRDVPLDGRFDYVICNPPAVSWNELSEEEQRSYAANFDRILVNDETIEQDILFLEQSIRHLTRDGRAVFITSTDLTDSAGAASFRDHHYYQFESVDTFSPDEHPQLDAEYLVTVVSNETEEEHVEPFRYDATEYEAMLANRVDSDRPFIATAIMTASPDGFHPDEQVSDVFFELHKNDYEAAPIYQNPESKTGVHGFVSRESIRSNDGDTVSDQLMELDEEYLLHPSTHLSHVIGRLAQKRFQFVGEPGDVDGIITRFDLNREPVYLHLFDCFSDFEIGLRKLIRQEAPNWQERTDVHISSRPEERLYTDRLACGKLGRLIDIVKSLNLDRDIRADIAGYETTLDDLKLLRDSVAHYNPIIHTMGEGPTADSVKRGARQLRREYQFLNECIEGLS